MWLIGRLGNLTSKARGVAEMGLGHAERAAHYGVIDTRSIPRKGVLLRRGSGSWIGAIERIGEPIRCLGRPTAEPRQSGLPDRHSVRGVDGIGDNPCCTETIYAG
jgi:hypothetical protein